MFFEPFWSAAPCVLLAVALTGCAAARPAPPPPAPPVVAAAPAVRPVEPAAPTPPAPPAEEVRRPVPSPAEVALAYADRARMATAAELQADIARLGALTESQRGAMGEMQFALALAQAHAPADTVRAQAALQRVLASNLPQAQALHALARLLVARLGEQRRAEEAAERHAAQVRDQQRRIDQLNERLQAVRALERSLTNRSPRAAVP